jgi:hypothetical protein
MISPVPGVTATKPGSCTKPLPGIDADIVDEEGRSVVGADAGGYLVIRRPWPAMLRTIWGDNARYLSTYWEKFQNRFYVAGDSAHRDKDGYFWIMGRIDDVLNVAGHRLGTMEIESALVSHPRVAEAAVVGKPHEVKGESVFAYVVCRGERPAGDIDAFVQELRKWVAQELGAHAKPDDIRFADNLPKTRSGKIMRRLLRTIARGDEVTQDISTLENPGILDQLRGVDPGARKTTAKPKPKAKAATPKAVPKKPAAAKASTPKKANMKTSAKLKSAAVAPRAASKSRKPKTGAAKKGPTPRAAARRLGKGLKRLAKTALQALKEQLPTRGKTKRAKKKSRR